MQMLSALAAIAIMSGTRVVLQTSSFASAYGRLRAALDRKVPPSSLEWAPAYARLEELDRGLPKQIRTRTGAVIQATPESPDRVRSLYWRTLDAYVFGCDTPSDLRELASSGPEKIGGYLDTKSALTGIASSVEEAMRHPVIGDKDEVGARKKEWKDGLQQKVGAMLDSAARLLQVEHVPETVNMLLIPESGGKEGMTIRVAGGTLIVLGAAKYEGASFAEVVLHECIHVLDASSPQSGFFQVLRKELTAGGVGEEDREKIVHSTIFALAAEIVRRDLDREHRDVGEVFGAYSRGLEAEHGRVSAAIRDMVQGHLGMKEAIDAIAKG